MAQKRTTFKYHLIQDVWHVWVHDDRIGTVMEIRGGWTCGLVKHTPHADRTEAADCVYDRSKYAGD